MGAGDPVSDTEHCQAQLAAHQIEHCLAILVDLFSAKQPE